MADELTDEEKVISNRIAEDAQRRIVSWAKWIVSTVTIVLAIFGFRAYSDFNSMIMNIDKKIDQKINEIDQKINEAVSKDVNEAVQKETQQYEKFSGQFIESIVNSRSRLQDNEDKLDAVEAKFSRVQESIERFEEQISILSSEAQTRYSEFREIVDLHVGIIESEMQVKVSSSIIIGENSSNHWNHISIKIRDAWEKISNKKAVNIAILSTGIINDRSDSLGNPKILPGYDFVSDLFIANDGDGRDPDPTDPGDAVLQGECGPGSASVESSWSGNFLTDIVGEIVKANQNISILPIRIMGKCGGSRFDINDGILWSAGMSVPGLPVNTNPAKIILLGFGSQAPCEINSALQKAINDVVAMGASVVAPAGNSGVDASDSTPAGCENVIAVAASDARGHLASYSNYGNTIDIMAPGGDMGRDDNNDSAPDGVLARIAEGYAYRHGTNIAAAHVAGVAALLLGEDPSLNPATLKALLESGALPRSSSECPRTCGAGLLQAEIASL